MRKLANSIARDIASPAGKMGSRSLFPVVAVPRVFFIAFFRFERKYYPLSGLQAPSPAPQSARQTPPAEGLHLRAHQRAFLGANNRRGSHCRALRLLFA